MRLFWLFVFAVLITAWQLTWLTKLTILMATPNLILAGILALAICQKEEKSYWWILIFALFFDLLTGRPFGIFTLSACLMFFSIELLAGIIFKQNNFFAVLSLVIIGILFFEFYQLLLIRVLAAWRLAEPLALSSFYFYAILPMRVLYNGILALVCFGVFKKSRLLNLHGISF